MKNETARRNSKTRNQIKRERIKTALMAAALIVLWAVCAHLFLKAWAHPAEQHISGQTYLATIQMDLECQ